MFKLIGGAFHKLPQNIVRCFSGSNVLWHLAAIVLTYALVVSGFDWFYFESTRGILMDIIGWTAAIAGMLLPIIIPVWMYGRGVSRGDKRLTRAASGVAQAEIIALFITSVYKFFTGRAAPELLGAHSLGDISRDFHFGFYERGIIWGWPSGHTMIAFAMAFALVQLYPESRKIRYGALAYALFIGLSISVSIHWFSDFAAGAIIGSLVGIVVGKSVGGRERT